MFNSIDRWERMLDLVSEGHHTRAELAELLGMTPRNSSRYIAHAIEMGYDLRKDADDRWHLYP